MYEETNIKTDSDRRARIPVALPHDPQNCVCSGFSRNLIGAMRINMNRNTIATKNRSNLVRIKFLAFVKNKYVIAQNEKVLRKKSLT